MIKQIKKILKNRYILILILSILVFFIVYFLRGLFISLDKILIYSEIKYNNKINSFNASKDIVVVEIDDKSIEKIGQYPFSRDKYIDFIKNTQEAGASIIAFDIILSDNGPDKKIDNELAKTIKDSKKIVLGAPIYSRGGKNVLDIPLRKFREGALGYGFYNPKVDHNTNNVYSFAPELFLYNPETKQKQDFYNFNIEILKNYYKISENPKKEGDYYLLGDYFKIPFASHNSSYILINFLRQEKFQHISFVDILEKNFNFNLKDKIIILGYTAQGMKDIFHTPNGIDFGVYVHANIVNTILNPKGYIKYFDKSLEWFLIFLLIIIAIYFNFSKNNRLLLLSNFAIFFIFFILPFLLLSLTPLNLVLNHPSSIIIAFILSITFSNIAKFLIENKNKKKLVKALGEYISKDIAQSILEGSGKINLKGENKKISIFFSDIAGFTTISEKMKAEELLDFLREYLGAMSNIIMDQHGFIDKYEGDAIMALFGVFHYEESSTYDNCEAALKQQQLLSILNKEWEKRFKEKLSVRMGIHTGEAIVGNIGATGRKLNYTALGDSVNLASRLEGINKFYNTKICVSEDAYIEVKDNFEFRKLDKIRVKGKNKPVIIYELLSEKGKLTSLKKEIIEKFEKALELYFDKRFEEAKIIFRELKELGDGPSEIFEERCEKLNLRYEAVIPNEGWDGIWTFEKK